MIGEGLDGPLRALYPAEEIVRAVTRGLGARRPRTIPSPSFEDLGETVPAGETDGEKVP
jgi:hypothetical protein